jgi:hypothetical protein
VLRYLRFVSETYGLVIPAAATRRAVVDLAVLVTMWSCAKSPVVELYGESGQPKKRRRTVKRSSANKVTRKR